jgi:hypothetical protein
MPEDVWQAFLANRERIEAFALRHGRNHQDWIAGKGLDAGELHPHALINAVWARILSGKATWDPGRKSIVKFFCGEIHNRVRSFTQKRPRPDCGVNDDELPSEDKDALVKMLSKIERAILLRYVGRHSEGLAKLAELMLSGLSKGEIETHLKISDDTRRRWEKKLGNLLEPRSGLAARPRAKKGKAS